VETARPVETWFWVWFISFFGISNDYSALSAEGFVRIELMMVLLPVKSRNLMTFRTCTETTRRRYAFKPDLPSLIVV